MTAKHPEPWKVVDVECIYVVDANGTTVLEFEHEMEEEARRIVSCINAIGYDREPAPCKVCERVAPLVDGECPDCRH